MTSTYHIGLFLLRFTFSAMMLSHGIPKLLNLIQGTLMKSDPIGIGVLATTILVVIANVEEAVFAFISQSYTKDFIMII